MQDIQEHLKALENSEKRLAALLAVSTAVNQSLDIAEVANVAAAKIFEIVPADGIMLFVLDEESTVLELRAHRGISSELASALGRVGLGDSPHGLAVRNGEPVLVSDPSFDPSLPVGLAKQENLGAQYIFPLKSRDQVVGTLCVIPGPERDISEPDRDMLGLIGLEIGIAIEKAGLYRKSEQAMKRYRELFEKAHDAIWVQDLQGLIVTMNQAGTAFTGYEVPELIGQHVSKFLNVEALDLAREVRQKLLSGEEVSQPYEQKIIRKDGKEATVTLTTSLLGDRANPLGFQHIARDITNERKLEEDLRTYISQISKAHEEERSRIARELHDDTIQSVVALSHRLDRLSSRWDSMPAGAVDAIEKMRTDLDNVLVRLRRFIQELRPPTLEYLGFLPALSELVRNMKQESGIQAKLTATGSVRALSKQDELLIYRIIQEALSNVRKHSGASKVDVRLEYGPENTTIRVKDDGRGFNQNGLMELPRVGKLGLAGMLERARFMKGTLTINSAENAGTTITLVIPAPKAAPAAAGPT